MASDRNTRVKSKFWFHSAGSSYDIQIKTKVGVSIYSDSKFGSVSFVLSTWLAPKLRILK